MFKPENRLKIPIISWTIPWAQRGLCEHGLRGKQRRMWDAEQARDALARAWASKHPHIGPPTQQKMGRSEVTLPRTTDSAQPLVLLPNKEYH